MCCSAGGPGEAVGAPRREARQPGVTGRRTVAGVKRPKRNRLRAPRPRLRLRRRRPPPPADLRPSRGRLRSGLMSLEFGRGDELTWRSATALVRGIRFLLQHQERDGLWRDFETPAGVASTWPTAFIAVALRSAVTGREAADRAAGALAAAQHDDGGWGYHEQVPSDADSTAWAMLLLAATGGHDAAHRRAGRFLIEHQHRRSGGIATYSRADAVRRFMGVGWWWPFWGWCRPHTEITAVAGRALAGCRRGAGPHAVDRAWGYVRDRQRGDGAWSSYWWTSPHYTTAQAVSFAAFCGERQVLNRCGDVGATRPRSICQRRLHDGDAGVDPDRRAGRSAGPQTPNPESGRAPVARWRLAQ